MLDTSRMPSYAFLSPQAVERREETTRRGGYSLLPHEKMWRDRQPGLQERGYLLRPRYRPYWKPSWFGTNVDPDFCEDSVILLVSLRTMPWYRWTVTEVRIVAGRDRCHSFRRLYSSHQELAQ